MKRERIYLALFALLFFCVTYAHQKEFDRATPVSRLDLLHALLVHHTVCINAYHTNTSDKAVFRGSYYNDKAPGTVALALVPFALSAGVLSLASLSPDSSFGWLFSSWVACAGSLGIVMALGGVALFAWLSRRVSSQSALVTTFALFLGAAPLPYATMMFSHALVVGLLAIAIWAIDMQAFRLGKMGDGLATSTYALRDLDRGTLTNSRSARLQCWFSLNRFDLFAGFACGWALASEYTAGIMVVGIFLWLLTASSKRAIPFCLAAVPPLLLIPAYSLACFRNPFILPYSLQATFPQMKEGLYAIKWPNPDIAFKLLFSPERGLLFWTPFLVMAGFGYFRLLNISPRLFWLTYAVPIMQVAVISGRDWDWPAGPTLGPRFLAPILPLVALPCAFGVQKFPRVGMALALYSILITTLATLTDACPDFNGHPNPLFDLHIPLFLKAEFSPNLGLVLGLPPYASVALFCVILTGSIWCLWRRLPDNANENSAKADGTNL